MKKIIVCTLLVSSIHLNTHDPSLGDWKTFNLEQQRKQAQRDLEDAQREVSNIEESIQIITQLKTRGGKDEKLKNPAASLPAAKARLETAKKEVEKIDGELQKAKEEYHALPANRK